MRRQGAYGGSNVNPLVAAQMQHIAAQRMQHNPGLNPYPARPDVPPLEEEQRYMSSKAEGHWQWEGGDTKGPNMPPHMYKEGQGPPDPGSANMLPSGPDAGSPFYQSQMPDPKGQQEKTNVKDVKGSEHEQQMEAAYQDPSIPQTLELLEQKFMDEIMKLSKEHNDAEDEENTRHQERTREINFQYQEKLRAMRAQQAKYREEFLRREAQMRQQKYQQAALGQLQHNPGGPINAFNENMHEPHGHGAGLGEGHPGYPGGYDSYRDRAAFYGNAGHPFNRNQGYDARGPYPGGRVYDSAPRFY
ncbi:hypothetical protein KI387_017291 [Taxus chinensis]|uniref:Uncharacterized protein n=1 Tax=Taxus chinensis TaxID=29808 RepID=A0AA38GIC3_TAXCH|nr:hypothetical protein KI387_017291 [Taxus chinensis]